MKRFLAWLLPLTVLFAMPTGCRHLPATADVKIMSWNLLNPLWGGIPVDQRCAPFYEALKTEVPDILGVQEASAPWHEAFATLEGYTLVNGENEGGDKMMTAFLYNPATLTLVENGIEDLDTGSDIRVVSWAVFEANGTKARFLITNTHPDSREKECIAHTKQYLEIVAKLQEEKALPLLCVGDFNATEKSDAYALHIEDGFTDCKYASGVELLDDIDSYLLGDYGGIVTKGQGSRDHVFYKGAVTANTFTTLHKNGVSTVSDHLPVVAEVTVSK